MGYWPRPDVELTEGGPMGPPYPMEVEETPPPPPGVLGFEDDDEVGGWWEGELCLGDGGGGSTRERSRVSPISKGRR